MRNLAKVFAGLAFLLLAALPAKAVDSLLLPFTLDRCTDTNGSPLNGCTATVYDAGTTTLKSVFTDSALTSAAANPIVSDSDGWFPPRYIGTGDYKVLFEQSNGVDIKPAIDNLPGATDTSSFAPTSASPEVSIIAKTSAHTVTSSDLGKCIAANPTGGSFTITLLSAATAGDGKTLCVRHTGTANQVTIATVSSQKIRHFSTGGQSRTTWVLTQENQGVWLVSDGADWHVLSAPWGPAGQHIFQVEDDGLSAPPSSPTAGAWYILAASPSGDWSSRSQHDLCQASGNGGWLCITPSVEGWLAYVKDENAFHFFDGSAWVALPNTNSPTETDLEVFVAHYDEADGTKGSNAAGSAWTKYPFDTTVSNTITGASMTSSVITLPQGTYCMWSSIDVQSTNASRLRLQRTDVASTKLLGIVHDINSANGTFAPLPISGCFTTAGTETYELQYFFESAVTNGLGFTVSTETGTEEVYGTITIINMASLEGPQGDAGAQGPQGADGLAGFQYNFNTDTDFDANGEITSGDVEFNNVTISSVTAVGLSDSDRNSSDISAFLATWDDSDSSVRGYMVVQEASTPANIAIFNITGASTDRTSHWQFAVTYLTHNGSFALNDDVNIFFARTGDKGDAGATGAQGPAGPTVANGWNFDNATTDADPGSGDFRFNNASISSATQIYIDNNERGGTVVSAYLDTWDDNGNASGRGTILLIDPSDSTIFHLFTMTGSVVDGTGYRKVTVSHVAGNGTFTNGNEVAIAFMAFGPAGAGLSNVVDDTTPQLGGDLDLNSFNIDFPTTANISDVLDEDNMATNSATALATQQSIKAYVDTQDATKLGNVVEDTTPQLGGQLDVNGSPIGDGTRELLTFTEDASAVNQINIENEATGSGPTISAAGDDSNIALNIASKGTGSLNLIIGSTTELTISGSAINAGNGATFQEAGTDISPIGQHVLAFPAGSLTARTTSGAACSAVSETSTNRVMVSTCDFDAAADEFAQAHVPVMPKGWNEGTVIARVQWTGDDITGDKSVVWGVQGMCRDDDDALDTAFGTAQTVTDANGNAANDNMLSAETAAITLAGSFGEEASCWFQIYRDADNASDNFTGDAKLLGFSIHLTMDAANDN